MLAAAIPAAIGGIASYFAGQSAADAARENAERNIAHQKEFAQHGIQWKVADAKAAGVHPLAALGASTHSFAPVSIGSSSMASTFSAMGQDVSRAMMAGQSHGERVSDAGKMMQALQVENASLQNDLLRSQISRLNQQATPSLPGGVPNITSDQPPESVKVEPSKTEAVNVAHPSQAAAVAPDVSYSRTATGLAPVPSKTVKELIEDITIPQLLWGLRNNILPIAGINQNPPGHSPGEGNVWVFHPGLGEYQPVSKKSIWALAFGRRRDVGW